MEHHYLDEFLACSRHHRKYILHISRVTSNLDFIFTTGKNMYVRNIFLGNNTYVIQEKTALTDGEGDGIKSKLP